MKQLTIVIFLVFFFACKKEKLPPEPTPPPKEPTYVYAPIASYQGKIPEIYINTNGAAIQNEPKIQANIELRVGDTIPLKTMIGIEYRGASSITFEQKSFGFEFWDSTFNGVDHEIMDLPKEEDFILYAPANDKSLLRNVLIYDLSNQMGLYAAKTRFVQLYLNNSYNGLYVLMEKLKRNKNRINISKMSNGDNEGTAVTGGYILKIDKTAGEIASGGDATYTFNLGFRSQFDTNGSPISYAPYGPKKSGETYFLYEYPKPEDITTQQRNYIQKYIDDFEKSLLSDNYKDPNLGYSQYIDKQSFADFFILNELSHNPDAYRLSTFLYKDKSGKLKMGPIWDFNIAFGNDDRAFLSATNNWVVNFNSYYPWDLWLVPFWYKRLLTDPDFTAIVKQRWLSLRGGSLSDANILATLNKHLSVLQANNAINRHFERWKFLGVKLPFNGFVGQTYNEELEYLKNWIQQRTAWMDQNINNL